MVLIYLKLAYNFHKYFVKEQILVHWYNRKTKIFLKKKKIPLKTIMKQS